jgi:hypothetical protein
MQSPLQNNAHRKVDYLNNEDMYCCCIVGSLLKLRHLCSNAAVCFLLPYPCICVQAWNAWLEFVNHRARKTNTVKAAVCKMLKFHLASSWDSWCEYLQSRKEARLKVSFLLTFNE